MRIVFASMCFLTLTLPAFAQEPTISNVMDALEGISRRLDVMDQRITKLEVTVMTRASGMITTASSAVPRNTTWDSPAAATTWSSATSGYSTMQMAPVRRGLFGRRAGGCGSGG